MFAFEDSISVSRINCPYLIKILIMIFSPFCQTLVPIATRYPPSNVQFEIADVNTPLRWENGTFDLVHSRSVEMAVRNIVFFIPRHHEDQKD